MKSKYLYLLSQDVKKREVCRGIYPSLRALKSSIIKMDKNKSYQAYKIPINKLLAKDYINWKIIQNYAYQYYGTFKELHLETDNGKIIKEENRKVVFWPK